MRFLTVLGFTVSLSAQIFNGNYYPPPSPPALPAANGWFTDPTYGTRILRATSATFPGVNTTCNIQGPYSYWPTLNSNSTRAMFPCSDKYYFLSFNAAGATPLVVTDSSADRFSGRVQTNGWWSRTDPDTWWSIDYGNTIYKYNASTTAWVVQDTVTEVDSATYYLSNFFMANDDNTWIATIKEKSTGNGIGFIAGTFSPRTIIRQQTTGLLAELPQTQIDRTGVWAVLVYAAPYAGQQQYIKLSDGTTIFPAGSGHRDVGAASVYYNGTWITNPNVVKWAIGSSGQPTTLAANMIADDFSALATSGTWLTTSQFEGSYAYPCAHAVCQVATDGSGSIIQWAHNQSAGSLFTDEPYPSQSYDNRFIAFQSNWGTEVAMGGRMDVYIIDASVRSSGMATSMSGSMH